MVYNIISCIVFSVASLGFLTVGILTQILIVRKNKEIRKNSSSISVSAGLVMPIFELAMFVAGVYCVKLSVSGTTRIPVVSMVFEIIFLLISINNLIYMRILLDNTEMLRRAHARENDSHNVVFDTFSHDIRNPMNTIVGMTEVIKKDSSISGAQEENIEALSNATMTLLGVVNNIMDYTKIQSSTLDIILADYSTSDLFGIIIGKAERLKKSTDSLFVYEISPDIPKRLKGDDVRIIQVVTNLISNSFKYTPSGVVTMRISSQNINSDTAVLNFIIEDSSAGPQEQDAGMKFDFADLAQCNEENKSTWISMFIDKSIVERMNGRISSVSSEDSGTIVTVSVPQHIEDPSKIGEFSPDQGEADFRFTAPMARILVVDDSMVNVFVARELLSQYGIEVTTASSGEESIALVRDNSFDLVFMDYLMPQMDGHEALEHIRKLGGSFKDLPVIALTAKNTAGGERMFIDEGFNGYLPKPLDVHDMEKILLRFLPPEYIERTEEGGRESDKGNIQDKAWFKRLSAVLTDFDLMTALESCDYDYSAYISLLRTIVSEGSNQALKIKSFADMDDLDNYWVYVHSLRSLATSAGDMKLSFICGEHENAARHQDVAYIRNHVNTLLSEHEVFLFKIDTVLQRENEIMTK